MRYLIYHFNYLIDLPYFIRQVIFVIVVLCFHDIKFIIFDNVLSNHQLIPFFVEQHLLIFNSMYLFVELFV
jgi:hypothetical protein